ncbi:MAG: CARDB domain-containing protein [Candidatus Woesearchaeota archaeon]
MRKPSWQTPFTIISSALLIVLFGISLISSGLFSQSSITGAVVLLGNVGYSAGEVTTEEDLFTGKPITFYINILNQSNNQPLDKALCRISWPSTNPKNMIYNSNMKQYQYIHVFQQPDTIEYTIECDMSQYGMNDIVYEKEIIIKKSLPDLTISVDVTSTVAQNSQIPITVTANNIGPTQFTGNVDVVIDFGDGSEPYTHSLSFSQGSPGVTIQHTYTTQGTYTVTATINPEKTIEELNYENNEATKTITVIEEMGTAPTCNNIPTNARMSSNLYCPNGITISQANTVLDCAGYRIYGDNAGSGEGITLQQSARIKDCTIDRFEKGIVANAPVTISNTTISETTYGIILNTASNTIKHNTLRNNAIGIQSNGETNINWNDFENNAYNINASNAMNVSYNFFNTQTYNAIIDKIKTNNHDIKVIPFLSESAKSPTTTPVYSDGMGPTVKVTPRTATDIYNTRLHVTAETSKESECRVSNKQENYVMMSRMSTTDGIEHERTFNYYDEKIIDIYVICRDTQGAESPIFKSEEIIIPSAISVHLNRLNDRKESIRIDKEHAETLKRQYEADLETITNPDLRASIAQDIAEQEIEIAYHTKREQNANTADSRLRSLQQRLTTLRNDITRYENNVEDKRKEIDELKATITQKISNQTVRIGDDISRLITEYNNYYAEKERLTRAQSERSGALGTHIQHILNNTIKDYIADKERMNELAIINPNRDYTSQITSTQNTIEREKDELARWKNDHILTEFDRKIELNFELIRHKENYRQDMERIYDYISSAQIIAENENDIISLQQLERLESSTERVITQAERDIQELNEQIDRLRIELSNYTRGTTKQTSNDDENDIIEFSVEWDEGATIIAKQVNEDTLLKEITFTFRPVQTQVLDSELNDSTNITNEDINQTEYENEEEFEELYEDDYEEFDEEHYDEINENTGEDEFELLSTENTTNSTDNGDVLEDNEEFLEDGELVIEENNEASSQKHKENKITIRAYKKEPETMQDSIGIFEWYEFENYADVNIFRGEMLFEINTTWLQEQSIPRANVKGFMYNDETERWLQIPTTQTEEDTITKYFSVATPLDNSFAIGYMKPETICEPVPRCGPFSECSEEGIKTRTCRDINQCREEWTEEESCTIEEPEVNDTEETPPPTIEQPLIPEQSTRGILGPMLLVLLLAVIGVGGYIGTKKGIIPNILSKASTKNEFGIDYKLLDIMVEGLFHFMDDQTILNSCGHTTDEKARYYLQMVRYIFNHLEQSNKHDDIVSQIVNFGWKKELADHLTEYITVRYILHQIQEYFSFTPHTEDEMQVMREILAGDGYKADIIEKAFTTFIKIVESGNQPSKHYQQSNQNNQSSNMQNPQGVQNQNQPPQVN